MPSPQRTMLQGPWRMLANRATPPNSYSAAGQGAPQLQWQAQPPPEQQQWPSAPAGYPPAQQPPQYQQPPDAYQQPPPPAAAYNATAAAAAATSGDLVVFDSGLINSVSLTGVVAAAPTTRHFSSGKSVTRLVLSTFAGPSPFVKSFPVEVEAWDEAGAALAAVPPGAAITVDAHLRGDRGRLQVVADAVWVVDPATIPGDAAAAPYDPNVAPAAGGYFGGAGGASGERGGWRESKTPPPSELAAAFAAPGGSFVALAQQHGVLETALLEKLLDAAKAGRAPVDWEKLSHEVEQFASEGAVPLSEVATAIDAWAAANPGALRTKDGSLKMAPIRTQLLAHPALGPRLQAAEAARAQASGSSVGSQSGTYALIRMCLGAKAAGVALH